MTESLRSQESGRCIYCDQPIKNHDFAWCWGKLTEDDDNEEILVIRHICKECRRNGKGPPEDEFWGFTISK